MSDQDSTPEPPRRLVRGSAGRLLAGVCSGLGRYTGIDPVVFRVGFALLVLADGWGILLYVAAALLMPADEYRLAPIEQLVRRRFDADAVLAMLGLVLAGGVLLSLPGPDLGSPLTTVAIFAIVVLVAQARGVNLVQFVRSLPERLQGHPATVMQAPPPGRPVTTMPPGAIDLAALSSVPSGTGSYGTYDLRDTVMTDVRTSARHRPGPTLGKVTILLAIALGAAMIPVMSGRSQGQIVQVTVATVLAVIALGLIVSAWYGRGHGLVAVGTLLSLALITTSVSGDPNLSGGRFGEVHWRPVDPAPTEQTYKLIAGDGRLDLTALPLRPGQVVTVHVEVGAGRLRVTVPRTAWVALDASVGFGDVTVDKKIHSGPRVKVSQVFTPETNGAAAPRIELHIRGRIGDLEVSRVQ